MKRCSCIIHIGIRVGILVFLVFPTIIQGYLPLETNVRSSVHGKILRDGLVYLKHLLQSSPDLKDRLRDILRYENDLYRGLTLADFEAGTVSILSQQLPRNELSHFFNPTSGTGYQLGRKISWIRRLERHGWLSKGISMLLGPTIPATEMVDWYYSRAIQMATKNMTLSLESLGYAAHIIMDSTVPQHASDCGEENKVCGLRRYETHLEGNYDDWNLTSFEDSLGGEFMTIREIQDLASETAGTIVRYGTLQSQPLLDLVDGDATEMMMNEAAKDLIPLAQQLVATLVLMFVSDLSQPVKSQEAVVLQILSVELDGKWSDKSSPADFRPFVTYEKNQGHENRGYFSNSNFVYTDVVINPYAWTYVQVIGKDNIVDQRNVSFHLEIHEVFAETCGSKCGKSRRKLLVASGGRTSIEITIPLGEATREVFVEGTSTGCDGLLLEINQCLDAVKVVWRVGRSSVMKGNTTLRELSLKSFKDFITPQGLAIIIVSILLLSIVCVSLLRALCKYKPMRTYWKSRKTRRVNKDFHTSQDDAKGTLYSDSEEVTPELLPEIPQGLGNRHSEFDRNLQSGLPLDTERELYSTAAFGTPHKDWSGHHNHDVAPQMSQMGRAPNYDNYEIAPQSAQFEQSTYHHDQNHLRQSSYPGWYRHREHDEDYQFSQRGWDQHHHGHEQRQQSSQMDLSPHAYDQAQGPNGPHMAYRGRGVTPQISQNSWHQPKYVDDRAEDEGTFLAEEERDHFPSVPTFGIHRGYGRLDAPYSNEPFNSDIDLPHSSHHSSRHSSVPTQRRSTTLSNHGPSVGSTSEESRIHDGSSHMSSRLSASQMSNRPAAGSVNYYATRGNSSPFQGHTSPFAHSDILANNSKEMMSNFAGGSEQRLGMTDDPSERIRQEIVVLERWEMLEDDTISETPPMPYPLNLNGDLTGQDIFCAHTPRSTSPPQQHW